MKKNLVAAPESTAGEKITVDNITDKKGFAKHWHGSVRWVDGLLCQGLPHLKIGARRVRIFLPEADEWMRAQFGTQRNGKAVVK